LIKDLSFNYKNILESNSYKNLKFNTGKLLTYIGHTKVNLYLPIVIKEKLICEGIRKLENQHIRFNLLPNMENESILDIGCNTGYILFQLHKKNAGTCAGIDSDKETLQIPKWIVKFEKLKKINFYNINFNSIDPSVFQKFDNVLFFSLTDYDGVLEELPKLLKIAYKRVIIEPANHSNKSKEEFKEWVNKLCDLGYKAKLLGFTDYQHRGLVQIDK
jgi:SAM-dependent methyltransferase